MYLVANEDVTLENGTNMELNYFLTEEDGEESQAPLYGICINKCVKRQMESEQTGALSMSKDFVLNLCKKLARNTITPMVMLEVIDDLIEE